MTTAFEFLSSVWGADDQGGLSDVHFIAEKTPTGMKHHAVYKVTDAVAIAKNISSSGRDAYFGCAQYEKSANRTADNSEGARSFWFDIDCGPDKAAKNGGYPTQPDGLGALRDCCISVGLPKPSVIVDSGNGLHVYWHFRDFISRELWRKQARELKKLAIKQGLRADPQRTADVASVLRVPETLNWKDPKNPKLVRILHWGEAIELQSFTGVLDRQGCLESFGSNLGPDQRGGNFPPSSAHEIIKHCPTLAHVAQCRGAVKEPLWRNMLGVVKFTTEGEPLCHDWSSGDPRYDKDETQQKIDKWTQGPTRCETFRGTSGSKCQGCKQTCKSPIQLGWSKDIKVPDAAQHEINFRYFVARVGGGVYVFDELDRDILPNGMSFNSFGQYKAGLIVDGRSVASTWLKSPLRRTYDSLAFDPSEKCAAGRYNLWRGLAVSPRDGKCGLIIDHIHKVWCSSKGPQFEYVMRWLGLLVQRPWIKPEVALVLRSKEGAGKTIIVQMLQDIFGVHGFATAQKDQVAGRFNGHLFDKVLVVLEEAFFAGDHQAVATAKALITNETLGYEAKGKDPFSAPNYAHVISLTNNDWAVPAGADTRRWMVLDIGEQNVGNHSYFSDLAEEIRNGGAEAFLYRLLNVDLTGFNPRALPQSNALHAQQVETLTRSDPVAGFLLHALSEGAFTVEYGAVDWASEISAGDMQESYARATARARHPPSFDVAAKKLRRLLPQGALAKVRKSNHGAREFFYQLPDLQVARQHFKSVTKVDPCAL